MLALPRGPGSVGGRARAGCARYLALSGSRRVDRACEGRRRRADHDDLGHSQWIERGLQHRLGMSARTLQRALARRALSQTAGRMRSRLLTFGALVAIGAVAWAFLVRSEAAMTTMAGDGPIVRLMWLMMRPSDALPYLLAAVIMWVAMMIAMMVPAVVPMMMVMRGVNRGTHRERDTFLFACGYLLGWSLFGVLAALVQLWLHARGVLGGDRLAVGALGAGLLLLAAGVYQLTPWKTACLRHCRSPAASSSSTGRPVPRRPRHGSSPRPLLRGLLLGADAADVRRRNDERAHDGGALRVHPRRAAAAGRSVGLADSRNGDDRVGRVADRLA